MKTDLIIADGGPPVGDTAKALGAFYTDAQIADFLVWWAIRSPEDTAFDPSFGGGVFLRSACKRLMRLGGCPASQVFGVELDPEVHARIAEKIAQEFDVRKRNLVCSDFFDVHKGHLAPLDAVVGNPPFIRYQRFSGEARAKALACALKEGVRLSNLASSWAPFLVHSTAMLKEGGRLAMVLPVEVGHATYALPVLAHLLASFARVTFLTFRRKLFPDLSEDTLLLLAERKGGGPGEFLWRDLAHAGRLGDLLSRDEHVLRGTRRMDAEALAQGRERLGEYWAPRRAIELYRELTNLPCTTRLGQMANVGIGYVTGANDYFHLGPEDVRKWGIPIRYLRPAVRRSRALSGLRFTSMDWRRASAIGEGGYLLSVESQHDLPKNVLAYLAYGEDHGIPATYKCRCRSPWYRVPHVYMPDAFLSYMSGFTPRLVANDAEAVAPNSLHVIRLHPETVYTPDGIAALWQTSLTRLSSEIEGHALGGGMLKLEPTEGQHVVLASPDADADSLTHLAQELDALVRNGKKEEAQVLADALVLKDGLGLSGKDCRLLRTSADLLRNRRYSRSAAS
jgi:adenine-specific DNA methylase